MQNVEYVNCYFFASEEEYNTHECLFEFMTDRQDLWSQQNNLNITFDRGFGTSGPSISLGIKFQLVFPNSKSFTTWMLILTV